jgi:hypothetical protein
MKTRTFLTADPVTTIRYTDVPTPELENGDHIYVHGVVFRLKNRRPAHLPAEPNNTAFAFDTDVVTDFDPKRVHIPAYWLNDWVIQGNHRALWARVES